MWETSPVSEKYEQHGPNEKLRLNPGARENSI